MARSGRADRADARIAITLLISLSVATMMVQRDQARERRASPLLTHDIQAPVATWLGAPIRTMEQAVEDARDGRRALEENKVLRRELADARAETYRLQAMRMRLRRLESLAGVTQTGDIPETRITARVVSDPEGPFVRSFLVSSGHEDGVREGMPVMSEAGMIGHVVSVGRGASRVLRLDDLNSRVAVMSERTGARAILAGSNADLAGLAFVANPLEWEAGDRILTSGDDGQLPQGLPVGTLVVSGDMQFDVDLDFRKTPSDWIVILPYQPMAEPGDADGFEPDPGAETPVIAATPQTDEAG